MSEILGSGYDQMVPQLPRGVSIQQGLTLDIGIDSKITI
jgi:hypothetical protein